MKTIKHNKKEQQIIYLVNSLESRFGVKCEARMTPEKIGWEIKLWYLYYKDKTPTYKIVEFYLEKLPKHYSDLEKRFDDILRKLSI